MAVRAAARVEQEVRAYPRMYDAFYRALNRSPRIRALVGRAKVEVRSAGLAAARPQEPPESPVVRQRREAAVARRLGLEVPAERP